MTGAINTLAGTAGGAPGVVQISGLSVPGINDTVSDPSTATALLIVRSDGTIDSVEGGTTTQLAPSTDWILPNAAASSNFRVRFTLQSGDTPNAGNSSTGSWLALGSDRSIGYSQASFGIRNGTILVEIAYIGEAPLDSGEYPITARVNP